MCKDGLLMMMAKICNDDGDDDINDYINVDDENVNEKTSGARSGCARVGSCLRHPSHQSRLPGHRLPGSSHDDDDDDDDDIDDDDIDDDIDDDDKGRLVGHSLPGWLKSLFWCLT